jgi:hypothetical protein
MNRSVKRIAASHDACATRGRYLCEFGKNAFIAITQNTRKTKLKCIMRHRSICPAAQSKVKFGVWKFAPQRIDEMPIIIHACMAGSKWG